MGRQHTPLFIKMDYPTKYFLPDIQETRYNSLSTSFVLPSWLKRMLMLLKTKLHGKVYKLLEIRGFNTSLARTAQDYPTTAKMRLNV